MAPPPTAAARIGDRELARAGMAITAPSSPTSDAPPAIRIASHSSVPSTSAPDAPRPRASASAARRRAASRMASIASTPPASPNGPMAATDRIDSDRARCSA